MSIFLSHLLVDTRDRYYATQGRKVIRITDTKQKTTISLLKLENQGSMSETEQAVH